MNCDWVWVDNQKKLASARSDIQNSPIIGVDTEYDSFRYFREKLCLIQIVGGSKTYLFDPFENLDISFLGNVFPDSETLKVIHAGDNDIRILNRDYGFLFKNVFDTHRAASVLGCNHLSLSNVVNNYLGVTFNKSKKMQRSQWEKRPLTDEQLHYAVQDTSYLLDLYRTLKDMLKINGLEEKAYEVFAIVEAARWSAKTLDPNGYMKIKECQDLSEHQKKRLKALYRWRFEKARETNKARFMILSDQNLIDLSKEKIDSISSLNETRVLSPRKVRDFGWEIIKTLHNVTQ